MFFPVLKTLQENNPQLKRMIEALGSFLENLEGDSRHHITATGVAQAIDAPRDKVVGLLMAAANLGLLRLKFRITCPITGGGIRDFDRLGDIPRSLPCDLCGEEHILTTEDVEYFFELRDQPVAIC